MKFMSALRLRFQGKIKPMVAIRILRSSLLLALTALTLCAGTHMARADLSITPVRIVFSGRDRSATVELLNLTKRTNTYRLKWMDMKMLKSGHYALLPAHDKDPDSVSNMVIFSPRQVTIAPNGHQTIRLSLRRPANLPPGEYRSHLTMVRLARQGPEAPQKNTKDVSMEINVNLGFSIPVIVRSGNDQNLKVSLVSPSLSLSKTNPPRPQLGIDIRRDSGNFSTYGTMEVYWTPPHGNEHEIGSITNIALYPETPSRHINVILRENPRAGILRVVYEGKYESDGKTWAEKSFPIGK